MTRPQVIFFGNGPLADYALEILEKSCNIVFHARKKEDLEEVKRLKSETPHLHGVLASYGVIIKEDVLSLFEPEGILNIHPSLLPKYRGPSPIETAILNGDKEFGVSAMKLVKAMDAGPIYHQTSLEFSDNFDKLAIYEQLAKTGATWIAENLTIADSAKKPLSDIVVLVPQQGEPTFTKMLDKSLSNLDPTAKTASELLNEIRAYQGFPKSKYEFYGLDCTIIKAHVADNDENSKLSLKCKDGAYLIIDELQPAGRKIMDAKSFLNGYAK